MRRLIFISLIILFCAIYYYSTSHDENGVAVKGLKLTQNLVNKVTNTLKGEDGNSSLQQTASTSETALVQVRENTTLDQMNEEQLATWINQEAPRLDSTRNNTAETEVRLQALARTLTSIQTKALKSFAINSSLPINNRIMSAYILTLAPENVSSDMMVDIAQEGLPDHGPVLPHSEAELKRSQELAIRYMQVDELASRAKTNADDMNKLRLLSQTAVAPEVRDYASKRLKDIH